MVDFFCQFQLNCLAQCRLCLVQDYKKYCSECSVVKLTCAGTEWFVTRAFYCPDFGPTLAFRRAAAEILEKCLLVERFEGAFEPACRLVDCWEPTTPSDYLLEKILFSLFLILWIWGFFLFFRQQTKITIWPQIKLFLEPSLEVTAL